MKVLVTGGAGRLGAMVVNSLAKNGHQVKVFDLPQANYTAVSSLPRVQVFKGDILNLDELRNACEGVDVALHLAAILPPYSERDLERAILVNYKGTVRLVEALEQTSQASLVLSSSVSVYGRTEGEKNPISPGHPLKSLDNYSKSKIMAEGAVRESRLKNIILRISGVYAAEPFEFPSPVQFKADQRVEFIDRDDVVAALAKVVDFEANGRVFNIAGGESWRMKGDRFISGVFEGFGFQGEVSYSPEYGYFDWYDTEESQKALDYQKTTFTMFQKKLAKVFSS